MKRIEPSERVGGSSPTHTKMDNLLTRELGMRKRMARSMFEYGGIVISTFLCLVTIMVVTTDISISVRSAAEFSVDFFLLLFCSYASYICCSDSGMKAGKASNLYIETLQKFDETKQGIIKNKTHCILGEFCKDYIATELKNAKTYYLVSAGIDYEDYIANYASLEDEDIDTIGGLSTAQKKAIKSANAIKPIKLSPERIIRHGGSNMRVSPLAISPGTRRGISYSIKFITSMVVSLGMSYIFLDDLRDPSWATFVLVCIKAGTVLYNCFSGYKCGYENIVIHSVQFMQEQISLMQQAEIYAAERYINNETQGQFVGSHTDGAGERNAEGELHG